MTAARSTMCAAGSRLGVVALLTVALAGCGSDVETGYGALRGPSLNGLAAFVDLLRDAGHATTARRSLPREGLERFGAVIVFEDSFDGMPKEMADALQAYLAEARAVTLVLVPRDGDWAIGYYRAIAARDDVDHGIRAEARRRAGEAETGLVAATTGRRSAATGGDGSAPLVVFADRWIDNTGATGGPGRAHLEPVERDAGAGIDVGIDGDATSPARTVRARWPLRRRLVPGAHGRVRWRSGDDPLLVETVAAVMPVGYQISVDEFSEDEATMPDGSPRQGTIQMSDGSAVPYDRTFELASAMPLLNGGLVDPGNRRLAEEFVALLPADATVLVVGSSTLAMAADDRAIEGSMVRLFGVPPLPWLVLQAVVALGLFCWWKAPIFGRPRSTPPSHVQDFGHHVAALASLLARCGGGTLTGAQVARQRIDEWKRLSTAAAQPGAGSGRRRTVHRWTN